MPAATLSTIAFVGLSALILVSAVLVVSQPNMFRAALSLGLVLVGVAGLFILLEAEFLAFVQILVYVGAILTLVIFAVMLTERLQGTTTVRASRRRLPAALVSLALFLVLATVPFSIVWPTQPMGQAVTAAALGQQFVTTLVLPFEVISLVFVAAMVGAIAIALTRTPRAPGR